MGDLHEACLLQLQTQRYPWRDLEKAKRIKARLDQGEPHAKIVKEERCSFTTITKVRRLL